VTSVPHAHICSTARTRSRGRVGAAATSLVALTTFGLLATLSGTAQAAATPVGLGTADSFAVLAGSGITYTGPNVITGDIGSYATPSVTGPGSIAFSAGSDRSSDPAMPGAKSDLATAYDNAAGQGPTTSAGTDLGGRTLTAGVYNSGSAVGLTGQLELDAAGNPDAVFVFQLNALTTASASSVVLLGGAQACNVYWQIASSATLGTTSTFRGNILALTSISLTTGATVEGRVLARNGAVTLDTNRITRPSCSRPVTAPVTPPGTPVTPAAPTTTGAPTSAPAGSGTGTGGTAAGSGAGTSGTAGGSSTRPVTYGQVARVPVGSVDTGDGSTAVEPHHSSAR
jgi:hypothetical protein